MSERAYLEKLGFFGFREFSDGVVCALAKVGRNTAVYIDLTRHGWESRYCYPSTAEAKLALVKMESSEEEPSPGWVSYRAG